jgi:hypothetical protein
VLTTYTRRPKYRLSTPVMAGLDPIGAKITWSFVGIVAFFAAVHANVV